MSYYMSYFGRKPHPIFAEALILLTGNEVVAEGGIEPPTQGFSVLCSTN